MVCISTLGLMKNNFVFGRRMISKALGQCGWSVSVAVVVAIVTSLTSFTCALFAEDNLDHLVI